MTEDQDAGSTPVQMMLCPRCGEMAPLHGRHLCGSGDAGATTFDAVLTLGVWPPYSNDPAGSSGERVVRVWRGGWDV